MGRVRVHVSKPGEPIVPNTGIITAPQQTYTSNSDNETSFYFGLGIIITAFIVVLLSAFFYKKWKKQGFSKRQLIPRVVLLAILSFSLSFAALNFVKNSTEDTIGVALNDNLIVSTDDIDIYVELDDEPVFATASGTVKIGSGTEGGYILKTFLNASDLVLDGDDNKRISSISSSTPTALSEGTWGISTAEIAGSYQDENWFIPASNEIDATIIKSTTYQTVVDDSTIIHYGVYVDPDTEPGTYVGTINFTAIENLVMQNIAEWGDTVVAGQEVFAIDKRDGRKYSVARLNDGNIWMTQNLDHDIDSTKTYTPADTDIPANWTPSISTYQTDTTIWNNSPTTMESYDPGDKYWNGIINDGSGDPMDYMTDAGDSHYHLGNYYNWTAAVAMDDSSDYTAKTATDQSICPAGWTLPIDMGAKSVMALSESYNNDGIRLHSSPVYLPYSGVWRGTFYSDSFGRTGYYQSSVSYNGMGSYGLLISSNLSGITIIYRRTGESIRCVARPVISDLTYMQDFSKLQPGDKRSVLASMEEDKQYQLKDIRDEKIYWISKLRDGRVWMTQNLDLNLDSTITYTHEDTDLGWGSDTETLSWTPVRSTIDATNVTNNTITGWSNNFYTPYSVDPGNYYWTDTPYDSVTDIYLNGDFGSDPVKWKKDEPFAGNGEHGHIGNYYNWSAAIAVNDSHAFVSSTITNPTENPQNSICPAGWRLPIISDSGITNEFFILFVRYENGRAIVSSPPFYFVRGGQVFKTLSSSGSHGAYWSSTVSDSNYASRLLFYSDRYTPLADGNRKNGQSIRCIVR